jgi:hypothetical protein
VFDISRKFSWHHVKKYTKIIDDIDVLSRFDHILKTKGIYTLGYFKFLKWNLVILPILALGASAVVIGEIWFIYLR